MSNAKRKNVLDTTAFFYCLKTLIPWFAITWPGFHVSKWFFFAEFFAEFVRKHTIKFLAEGETFVLAHLHGCRDVGYKPVIQQTSHLLGSLSGTCRVRQGLPPLLRLNTRFGLRAWRLHITLTLVFPVVMWSYNMIYNYLLCTDKQLVCSVHLFYRENGENEEWFNKLHSWKPV